MNTHRSGSRALLMMIVVAGATACGGGTPTAPTPVFTTDTFTGTLNTGGSISHQFTALTGGDVAIAVNSVAPVSTLQLGLGLGQWNGTACVVQLSTTAAKQGDTYAASVAAGGSYCITMYDAGTVTETTTYSVQVTHP